MSDEKAREPEVDKVGSAKEEAEKLNEHILRPIDELIKSMQTHDMTIREILGGLKRLFKQSKGQGTPSLTEHIQMFAALYGLVHLGQTQNVIIGQQLANDMDRMRWHLFALQEFFFTALWQMGNREADEVALGRKPEAGEMVEKVLDYDATMTKWRAKIDVLFRAEKQKAMDTRAALFDKHKEDVLGAAVDNMKRPALPKKEEVPSPEDKKVIQFPRG